MATLTPNTNPSQALVIVGWPLVQSNGAGDLRNHAEAEGNAVTKSAANSVDATILQTAINVVGAGNRSL